MDFFWQDTHICVTKCTIEGHALDIGLQAGEDEQAGRPMAARKNTAVAGRGGPKSRAGEPERGAKSPSTVVMFRTDEAHRAQIEAAAAAADLTVSSFIRSLSLEGAGVRPFLSYEDRMLFAALAEEFRAVGVNLNQVARAINAKREVHPEEVIIALDNVLTMAGVIGLEVSNLAKRGPSRRREVE